MPTTANEKISIAMTTYNGERYLRQQMDSLLAQTLPFDELVVFDDASTDSTVEILQTYAKNDPRIKIEINKKNRGFRLNFENAIAQCEGDLIHHFLWGSHCSGHLILDRLTSLVF